MLGILTHPTNPLHVGKYFGASRFASATTCSFARLPADLTGSPRPTETFTSRLPMSWSPSPPLDMTTAATGQFLPMGLSPTRTTASFAAPEPKFRNLELNGSWAGQFNLKFQDFGSEMGFCPISDPLRSCALSILMPLRDRGADLADDLHGAGSMIHDGGRNASHQ